MLQREKATLNKLLPVIIVTEEFLRLVQGISTRPVFGDLIP